MLKLSSKWITRLTSGAETGMGYQIATVFLKSGEEYAQCVIAEGMIVQVRGRNDIPFAEPEIADIAITHDKWDFQSDSSL
jgi:hypothetical protein